MSGSFDGVVNCCSVQFDREPKVLEHIVCLICFLIILIFVTNIPFFSSRAVSMPSDAQWIASGLSDNRAAIWDAHSTVR